MSQCCIELLVSGDSAWNIAVGVALLSCVLSCGLCSVALPVFLIDSTQG